MDASDKRKSGFVVRVAARGVATIHAVGVRHLAGVLAAHKVAVVEVVLGELVELALRAHEPLQLGRVVHVAHVLALRCRRVRHERDRHLARPERLKHLHISTILS